jgi:NAD kinase
MKLLITTSHATAEALNDVVIHNADPRHAIRYSVTIDNRRIHNEVIGDGIVCATPLGSTGYYRSITDGIFESGIGLAFNNSTEQTDHIVVSEKSILSFVITRGPAFCYADNQENFFELNDGDTAIIQKSKNIAKIISVDIKGL